MVEKGATNIPSSSTSPNSDPLHIEKPSTDFIILPRPKGVLWKLSYNPNVQTTQHYNIVEYFSQTPSTMSALEVLQTCPLKWKALLSTIGGIDPTISSFIIFALENRVPHLLPHLDFLIQVVLM